MPASPTSTKSGASPPFEGSRDKAIEVARAKIDAWLKRQQLNTRWRRDRPIVVLCAQPDCGIDCVSRHDRPLLIPQEPTGVVSSPGPSRNGSGRPLVRWPLVSVKTIRIDVYRVA